MKKIILEKGNHSHYTTADIKFDAKAQTITAPQDFTIEHDDPVEPHRAITLPAGEYDQCSIVESSTLTKQIQRIAD